jgi:hypothetical protein
VIYSESTIADGHCTVGRDGWRGTECGHKWPAESEQSEPREQSFGWTRTASLMTDGARTSKPACSVECVERFMLISRRMNVYVCVRFMYSLTYVSNNRSNKNMANIFVRTCFHPFWVVV